MPGVELLTEHGMVEGLYPDQLIIDDPDIGLGASIEETLRVAAARQMREQMQASLLANARTQGWYIHEDGSAITTSVLGDGYNIQYDMGVNTPTVAFTPMDPPVVEPEPESVPEEFTQDPEQEAAERCEAVETSIPSCNYCGEPGWLTCEHCSPYNIQNRYDEQSYDCDGLVEDDTHIERQQGFVTKSSKENVKFLKHRCVKAPASDGVLDWLDDFYQGGFTQDRYNKFTYIKEDFFIEMQDIDVEELFVAIVDGVSAALERGGTQRQYKDRWSRFKYNIPQCRLDGYEGKYIIYDNIDMMGKRSKRKESILVIYEYAKKFVDKFVKYERQRSEFGSEYLDYYLERNGRKMPKTFGAEQIKCVMTNDVDIKMDGVDRNGQLRSCQNSDNYRCYAVGARDFVMSDTHIPIFIYKEQCGEERIVGRMNVRIMYDNDGNQVLLVDRLYTTDGMGSFKEHIYKKIMKKLWEMGYTLAVANRSYHDAAMSAYIEGEDWITRVDPPSSLRSPERRRDTNPFAYYHDSYTKTYSINGSNLMYDYIQKSNFYIIKEKDGTCKKVYEAS